MGQCLVWRTVLPVRLVQTSPSPSPSTSPRAHRRQARACRLVGGVDLAIHQNTVLFGKTPMLTALWSVALPTRPAPRAAAGVSTHAAATGPRRRHRCQPATATAGPHGCCRRPRRAAVQRRTFGPVSHSPPRALLPPVCPPSSDWAAPPPLLPPPQPLLPQLPHS